MSLLHTFYTNGLAFVSSICIHLISCTFAVHFSKLETLASLVTGRLAPDWESHCRFLGNVIFDNWNCMCSFLWLGSSFFKVGLKRWGCTGLKKTAPDLQNTTFVGEKNLSPCTWLVGPFCRLPRALSSATSQICWLPNPFRSCFWVRPSFATEIGKWSPRISNPQPPGRVALRQGWRLLFSGKLSWRGM